MNIFKTPKERIILVDGKDTGVRENNKGYIYINHRIFLKNPRVQEILLNVKKYMNESKSKMYKFRKY